MPKASPPAGICRASLAKIHELDDALELMYFGWRGMTLAADNYLAMRWCRARIIVSYTSSPASPASLSALSSR